MEQVYRFNQSLKLRVLYPRERIEAEVSRLASEIAPRYADKKPLAVIVLKGALFFAADLLRAMRIPVEMDFLQLSSYDGKNSTGKVLVSRDLLAEVAGRDVLVIEDLVDTGLTLDFVSELLRQRGASSLALCTLIDRRGGAGRGSLRVTSASPATAAFWWGTDWIWTGG